MTQLQKLLEKVGACQEAKMWVGDRTATQAWDECTQPYWLLFICAEIAKNEITQHEKAADDADKLIEFRPYSESYYNISLTRRRKWCNRYRELVKRPKFPVAKKRKVAN